MEKIKRFFKEEEGVTAIEYGLIAALIACDYSWNVTTLGTQLKQHFQTVARLHLSSLVVYELIVRGTAESISARSSLSIQTVGD